MFLGAKNMKENRFLDEIMSLEESEDIKRIVKRWENFSRNKSKFETDAPLVLPDMLWISKSGYGTTNLLGLLSEYMYQEKIMEFYGDVKFLEFDLEYCSGDNSFISFEKFRDAIQNAAGFRNEYKGIVCININSWVNHINERNFVKFLEYLSVNSDVWHIIFVIDSACKDKLDELEAILSVYFRIEKVTFNLPDTQTLYLYMEKRIKKYGFIINEDAKNILIETIDELRKSKYFDGYKTLNMICSDLVYREFSTDKFESYEITKETAEYYSKKSDFVIKAKSNFEKRNKIGYGIVGGDTNE